MNEYARLISHLEIKTTQLDAEQDKNLSINLQNDCKKMLSPVLLQINVC